jgi:hypothetical protein
MYIMYNIHKGMPQITPLLTLMLVHTWLEESIPSALFSACNVKLNSLQPTCNFPHENFLWPKIGGFVCDPTYDMQGPG